jgi:hypothetical protein
MKLTRRTFLGLLGGTIVAAATPADFQQLVTAAKGPAPGPDSWRYVQSLWLHVPAAGLYEVQRASGAVLLQMHLAQHGIFCWEALGNYEITLRPGEPALCLAGPAVPDWKMTWGDQTHTYETRSRGWTLA